MREDAATKAVRLLTCGRLTVEWIDTSTIRATCRGDSGEVYTVGYQPDTGWTCNCPARGRCSHLQAVQLVVVVSS